MKTLISVALVSALIFVTGCAFAYLHWPDANFHFITCDVGQGDGLIFTLGFFQLVVDTGYDERMIECLSNHMPFWDRTIEAVIISHADFDHVGGLLGILERYQVKTVVMNPSDKENPYLDKVYATIDQRSTLQSLYQGQKMIFSSGDNHFSFTAIWPKNETEPNIIQRNTSKKTMNMTNFTENQRSISGVLEYGQLEVMLTGDIDSEVEQALVTQSLLLDVDVLKIAHHGSKTSTSNTFVEQVAPEVAVLSYGQDNSFGHPHTSVISVLQAFNVRPMSTVEHGTIEIISNGTNYWIK